MANLIPFQSWADVLTYARTGQPLYYQAPMDHQATRLRPGAKTIFGFEVRAKTIRIWPSGSLGRGRQRTSDPFNADKGHLSRFSHPLENELPGRHGAIEHHRQAQAIFFRTRDAIEKQDAFTVSGMDAQITILKDAIRQMSPYAGHKYDTPGRITHGWSVAGAPEWMHSFKEWLERAEARRASLKKHYAETGATKHESGGNPRTSRRPARSQEEHFTHPHAKSAGADETMLNLLYGPNPITDDELRKLIAKRPHVYGKYAAYLGKRGQGAKHESGGNPRISGRGGKAPIARARMLGRQYNAEAWRQWNPGTPEPWSHPQDGDFESAEAALGLTRRSLSNPRTPFDSETSQAFKEGFKEANDKARGKRHESGGNPRTARSPLKLAHEHGFKSAILQQEKVREKYNRLVRESEAKYGSHGPLVSGVVREHFPAGVKARLRALVNDMNALGGAALTHHRGTGRRRHYSTLKDQVLKDRVSALVGKKS